MKEFLEFVQLGLGARIISTRRVFLRPSGMLLESGGRIARAEEAFSRSRRGAVVGQ